MIKQKAAHRAAFLLHEKCYCALCHSKQRMAMVFRRPHRNLLAWESFQNRTEKYSLF